MTDTFGMSLAIDGVRLPPSETPASDSLPERDTRVRAPESSEPSPFAALVVGVGGNIEAGERIMAGAASGYSSLDPAELIALQAGIYRYSEAVDLTAKLVDRMTSAVRTVLSGGH